MWGQGSLPKRKWPQSESWKKDARCALILGLVEVTGQLAHIRAYIGFLICLRVFSVKYAFQISSSGLRWAQTNAPCAFGSKPRRRDIPLRPPERTGASRYTLRKRLFARFVGSEARHGTVAFASTLRTERKSPSLGRRVRWKNLKRINALYNSAKTRKFIIKQITEVLKFWIDCII